MLVDLESKEIKRFYNMDFFNKEYKVNLMIPSFCRRKILRIEEIYYYNLEYKTENCIDVKFVEKKFDNMLKHITKPICDFISSEVDYYMMIYYIRLDNWMKKYDIKII